MSNSRNPHRATWRKLSKRAGYDKDVEIIVFNRADCGVSIDVDGYKYVPTTTLEASRDGYEETRGSLLKASLWLAWRILMEMSFWYFVQLVERDEEARRWVKSIAQVCDKALAEVETKSVD